MKDSRKRSTLRRGFSLIELMVVVGILAILLLISIPALLGVMEAAQIADCKVRLTNIYKGVSQWAEEHNGQLPILTNGTGADSVLAPYKLETEMPEVAVFVENYLRTNAEEVVAGDVVRMSGSIGGNPMRCPVSNNVYGDAARYTSYEFVGFSQPVAPVEEGKNNNGHGNNQDGVDSSNQGNSKEGEDTNPYFDDENKAIVGVFGAGGVDAPVRTYLNAVRSSIVGSSVYEEVPNGQVVLAMDRIYSNASDPRNSHAEGANVLYGDGSVYFVLRQEYATADEIAKTEILTEIGADDALRPNRSFGWHGGPSETTFFYPGTPLHGTGAGITERLKTHGAPGTIYSTSRIAGSGIFY